MDKDPALDTGESFADHESAVGSDTPGDNDLSPDDYGDLGPLDWAGAPTDYSIEGSDSEDEAVEVGEPTNADEPVSKYGPQAPRPTARITMQEAARQLHENDPSKHRLAPATGIRGAIGRVLADLSITKAMDRSYDGRVGMKSKALQKAATELARERRIIAERERLDKLSGLADSPTYGRLQRQREQRIKAREAAYTDIDYSLQAAKPSWTYRATSRAGLTTGSFRDRVEHERTTASRKAEPSTPDRPTSPIHSDALDQAKADGDITAYKKELRRLAGEAGFSSRRELYLKHYDIDLDAEDEAAEIRKEFRQQTKAALRAATNRQRGFRDSPEQSPESIVAEEFLVGYFTVQRAADRKLAEQLLGHRDYTEDEVQALRSQIEDRMADVWLADFFNVRVDELGKVDQDKLADLRQILKTGERKPSQTKSQSRPRTSPDSDSSTPKPTTPKTRKQQAAERLRRQLSKDD